MGAYLSQPNTVKCSGDGVGAPRLPLPYGFSAMQGWRVSMEDAHNCIPELDSETAMFSVYDGHGGEEVALYCAKYLPDIIKDQKAYKEGKLQKALEDAFLAIDAKLTTEEVIKELAQIAGRPTEDEDEKEKVADEDDGDHFYKRNKNLPPEEQMISALPDIKVLTLTDDHEFMVIACDGIWNVMSSQEVIDFIQSKISQRDENGELRLLSSIVEELLDQCLAPDTSGDGTGCDNMTCIIICFKPRNTAELQPESGKRKLEEVLSTEGAEENGNSDNKKKAKRD
uniref:protein-serine/threonine phosphatase n=1 Tax=Rousettus aegyptiacus TaxID=9407 RepID=A0A7J8FLD6_ROUAE|nr:protein phosphatase, Mg2+/Mn2+ dependent 1G [Rousettus aegyptiacus]